MFDRKLNLVRMILRELKPGEIVRMLCDVYDGSRWARVSQEFKTRSGHRAVEVILGNSKKVFTIFRGMVEPFGGEDKEGGHIVK